MIVFIPKDFDPPSFPSWDEMNIIEKIWLTLILIGVAALMIMMILIPFGVNIHWKLYAGILIGGTAINILGIIGAIIYDNGKRRKNKRTNK